MVVADDAVTEQAFFVLAALAGEPRHGYGIVGEVERLSDGRVRLKVGTLYGVLDRLVADGLVGLDREEVAQGRPRRDVRLTEAGPRAPTAEAERPATNAPPAPGRPPSARPR